MTQGYNPDNKVMAMTYDAENRLTSAQYTDGGGVVRKTEYSYSGNNMLETIKKYASGNPVTETNFVRAGFLPLQERDGSNQVTREYTWGLNYGGGIGGLLGMKQGAQNYYYLYDGKGNVSAVIDSSSTVVASYRYDAFGNLISDPAASTLDQPFRFSTKRYDADTGLYYYGYRYYSPLMGKWITRDPIAEAGGINLYGFVGNSPMNYLDPYGLESSWYSDAWDITKIIAGKVAGELNNVKIKSADVLAKIGLGLARGHLQDALCEEGESAWDRRRDSLNNIERGGPYSRSRDPLYLQEEDLQNTIEILQNAAGAGAD